jgi:hypothetical protein
MTDVVGDDVDSTEHYQLFGLENEAAADGVEFLPADEVTVYKVLIGIIGATENTT